MKLSSEILEQEKLHEIEKLFSKYCKKSVENKFFRPWTSELLFEYIE